MVGEIIDHHSLAIFCCQTASNFKCKYANLADMAIDSTTFGYPRVKFEMTPYFDFFYESSFLNQLRFVSP